MKTRQELVAIALAHAESETRDDFELTLSTLEPDPVYELQPVGRVMRASAAKRFRASASMPASGCCGSCSGPPTS